MTGTYEIIYADPPWRYSAKKVQGAAENHYPTMSISELCALPVADLAAKDSALFLWATFPQLPEALRLIQAWGFTYKSVAFVWLKQNRKSPGWFYGLGFWTRGNAEVCLLATRGHPKRQSANVHQFIISPVREHSRKPEEARDKIVALMGDVLLDRGNDKLVDVCRLPLWVSPCCQQANLRVAPRPEAQAVEPALGLAVFL